MRAFPAEKYVKRKERLWHGSRVPAHKCVGQRYWGQLEYQLQTAPATQSTGIRSSVVFAHAVVAFQNCDRLGHGVNHRGRLQPVSQAVRR